jgi:hypothetical protein
VLPEAAPIRYSGGLAVKRASHCVYDTRYHLVWAPKYRKWVLQGAIRQRVKELFQEIAEHHGFAIEELEVDKDHVAAVSEVSTEVLDWAGGRAVQGGQCEGDSGGIS